MLLETKHLGTPEWEIQGFLKHAWMDQSNIITLKKKSLKSLFYMIFSPTISLNLRGVERPPRTSSLLGLLECDLVVDLVVFPTLNKTFQILFLCVVSCFRCPWCYQHFKQETKAPRPASQQPVLCQELLLTWTPQSCSPQLELWTRRTKSHLLITGASDLHLNSHWETGLE